MSLYRLVYPPVCLCLRFFSLPVLVYLFISLCDCVRQASLHVIFLSSPAQGPSHDRSYSSGLSSTLAAEGSSSVSSPVRGSQTVTGHAASVLLIHWVREMT